MILALGKNVWVNLAFVTDVHNKPEIESFKVYLVHGETYIVPWNEMSPVRFLDVWREYVSAQANQTQG